MKGLSQVITSTLILAVGISIAGIYANWAPGFAEDVAADAADQRNQELRCSNADLRLENVKYDLTGGFTEIKVVNTGTINLRDDLTAATFNQSRTIGSTEINQIEVDTTRKIRVNSNEIPEQAAVISDGCEELETSTRDIEIS